MFIPFWLILLLGFLFLTGLISAWRLGRSRGKSRWSVSHPNFKLSKNDDERKRIDFVANASHELRTPVSIIKGFAESLLEDFEILSKDQKKDFLIKIQRNSLRLNVLVEDLLSLARLGSKAHGNVRQNLDLSELIQQVVENFQVRAQESGTSFSIDLPDENLKLLGDKESLISVFENLLENALVHADNLTLIRVRARHDKKSRSLVCSVEDNGQGIPPNDLARLFERFYRVDKGRSRKRGGTGLGLSIVREVIEAHKGEVFAQSKLGKGSVFSFRLPKSS